MENPQILAIKTTLNTEGWKVITKEYQRKKDDLDRRINSLLANSSCIFDEKVYIEVTKLSFEKSIIDMFLQTPLEIINRLDVQM